MQIIRESIFISAIRAFINGLLTTAGVLIGLIILVSFFASSVISPTNPEQNLTLEILPDAEGNVLPVAETNPVVLQIDIDGVIGTNHLTSDIIETMLRSSRKGALKNDRVKAIFLNINSPGGSALHSSDIYLALERYKKKFNVPIYAYINGLCASGGYYISCAADYIGSSPLSITGSVGVLLGPFLNYHGLAEKWGIDHVMISQGKDKLKVPILSELPKEDDPNRPWADLEEISKFTYQQFVDVVVNSRPGLTEEMLINTYGAKVYSSTDAQKNHYIDNSNITRDEILSMLTKSAGIEGTYQMYRFKYKSSFLDLLKHH